MLMFLMLMLPLQFSWAGVSAYCQHETGAAAQHVGHHDHQHQKASEPGDAGNVPGKAHADCGYCHLAHSCAAVADISVPAFSCDAAAVASQPDSLPSHFPEGPERPNWVRPA